MEERRRFRAVLLSSPLQGHMTPMLQLAAALHSKGFSITIAHSTLNPPDPRLHPRFFFLPLSSAAAMGGGAGLSQFAQFIQALSSSCTPPLTEYLANITRKQNEQVIVIHDNLMFFVGSVAAELNIPSIVLRSSSAAFFTASQALPLLHQQGRLPVQDSMLQEIVPELHPFRYKDLPFIGNPIQETLELISLITPKAPSAFIWNTVDFLENPVLTQIRQHYQVPVFAIGPLHTVSVSSTTSFLEEDTSCIPWLDKQAPRSVIYVSLGSLATIEEQILAEMAWGLANSNQPFLWVVRPGSVRGSEWVELLPAGLMEEMKGRGLIVKWAPQKEVLAHSAVGGFWSHCGWNSTLESISEGAPMLCQPFDVDQGFNSRYVSYVWKMGIEIELQRASIEKAIRRILRDEEGEEMRQRAMEIQEKVKAAVSNGGSSHTHLNDLVEFILSL